MKSKLQAELPRKLGFQSLAVALLLSFVAAGCEVDGREDRAEIPEPPHQDLHVDWFEGEVEAAFDRAKELGKPVFLYWGAEWCPPCHYLKNKVFTRPEFLARITNFIPVYLDGDTERAQIWGERLDVQGYPTVIVFNATGNEVMRLSSSVPVDQYAAVLDEAVSTTRSIREVLDAVLTMGPSQAPMSDLVLLANYSWSQAGDLGISDAELQVALKTLSEETPESNSIERSRFLTAYVQSLLQNLDPESDAALELDAKSKQELSARISDLLQTDALLDANLVFASFGVDDKVNFLTPEPGTQRDELMTVWERAAESIEANESLTIDDRLGGTVARVTLEMMSVGEPTATEQPEASPEIEALVDERIAWALSSATDPSQLQSVVNTLGHILEVAGLEARAESLMIETMDQTTAPYYFMAWVADIKERSGDVDGALQWYRNAYESSRGSYSRFRYGSIYLRRLMDLQPQATEAIQQASIDILGELLEHPDAFAGGNYSRLVGLEEAYRDWDTGFSQEDTLANLRQLVHESCSRYSQDTRDEQYERCEAFLIADDSGDRLR